MSRSCGTCTLCCKVMTVVALDKPLGQWCPHCAIGKGCGIYETRPAECRQFMCAWLVDQAIPEVWKPEKSKIVLVADNQRHRMTAYVDPATPGAWKKPPYHGVLIKMMQDGLAHGAHVLIVIAGRTTLLLPDGEHDLGVIRGDATIAIGRTRGLSGDIYNVSVGKVSVT